MNIDAHLAVRRLYVQLRRAEQLGRRHNSSDDSDASSSAAAAAAEEPDPQPPESSSGAPGPCPPVGASAPPAQRRQWWPRRRSEATSQKTALCTPSARADSASRASRFTSWLPVRLGGRGRRSSSAARAEGGGGAGAQPVDEVRQWKVHLATTLRAHCVVVEACLRNLLAENINQGLAAAAACLDACQASPPKLVDCPSSRRALLRILSTGYAVTLSMETMADAATPTAASNASHGDGDGGGAAVETVTAQHAKQSTRRRARPSVTSRHNPLVPPPRGGVSTVHDDADDGDEAERGGESNIAKRKDSGASAQRTTAETTPTTGDARPTLPEKCGPTWKTALLPPQPARRAPATAARSFCEQLEKCTASSSLPWRTAGTPANTLLFTPTAAVCGGLHALQSSAVHLPSKTPAGDGHALGSSSVAQCTLWEYLPLCSSLHNTTATGCSSPSGAPESTRSTTTRTNPLAVASTPQSDSHTGPALPPPPPPPPPPQGDAPAHLITRDPLALKSDGDWHARQASLRAVQACAAHLASKTPSTPPPTLTASVPTSVRSLVAPGACPAVVEVHYSVTPSELQAVSWSLSTPHSRGRDTDALPRVSQHATWALCVEVDAMHAPWLLQTLLAVASTATSSVTGGGSATAAGLGEAVHGALRSFANVNV